MKLSSIFATLIRQTSTNICNWKHEGVIYPLGCCARKNTAVEFPCDPHVSNTFGLVWRLVGKLDGLFLIYTLLNFISRMPNQNEIKVAGNNSTRNSALGHETATSVATVQLTCNNPYSIPTFDAFIDEAKRLFDIECDAKNRAYAFIIEKGLIREFASYCHLHANDNPHAAAVAGLYAKINTTE